LLEDKITAICGAGGSGMAAAGQRRATLGQRPDRASSADGVLVKDPRTLARCSSAAVPSRSWRRLCSGRRLRWSTSATGARGAAGS
jgi:hypothetical protein